MASLEIASVQPCLQSHLVPLGSQSIIHAQCLPNPWISSKFCKKINLNAGHIHIRRGRLVVNAVATLELKCPDEHNNLQLPAGSSTLESQNESTSEDPEIVAERERMRRMRISKANKGNTPWNKGRKHSPETLQKIKERTKLAMQNPKVKMKLVNLGHAQSDETKLKIGVGVRMGWERRRVQQQVQETCHFQWQNLIAEAAKRGYIGEEELLWDSYKILNERLSKEWFVIVEQKKNMPIGNRRGLKTPEQRRKIAEAIAAKWADPEYRDRVCSGMAKYHKTPTGAKTRPRRKPGSTAESTKRVVAKKSASDTEFSSNNEYRSQIEQLKLRKRKTPVFKDPLACSKLEMIRNIRAQRAVAQSKKLEAVERARLLIADAEEAAKALEIPATKSPVAQASLAESRKLIAEATRLIESIESQNLNSDKTGTYESATTTQQHREIKEETESENRSKDNRYLGHVNGTVVFPINGNGNSQSADHTALNSPNGVKETLPVSSIYQRLPEFCLDAEQTTNVKPGKYPTPNGTRVRSSEANGITRTNTLLNGIKAEIFEEKEPSLKRATVTKKWVCGRLVEVTEEA